jgi:hypothetical protein
MAIVVVAGRSGFNSLSCRHATLTEVLCDFLLSLQLHFGIAPKMIPDTLPTTSFPVRYFSIIPTLRYMVSLTDIPLRSLSVATILLTGRWGNLGPIPVGEGKVMTLCGKRENPLSILHLVPFRWRKPQCNA